MYYNFNSQQNRPGFFQRERPNLVQYDLTELYPRRDLSILKRKKPKNTYRQYKCIKPRTASTESKYE